MADTSANGSLRGANMTRVTSSTAQGRLLHDPHEQLYGPHLPPRDPLDNAADPNLIHRDIPITALTGDWTINGIRGAISAHKLGQFAASAMLVDDAFGDDRVQATLGSRTGALFGQRVTHRRSKADTDGECRRAWRRQWKNVAAQGVLSEIKRWAIMIGFGVAEVLWDTSRTPWRMFLKPWHPQYIYYRWDIRRLVANTTEGPVVIEPGDGKWFVHAPFGMYRGWIHGAIRAIADKWMIKQLAWRDWARFNERHGLPIIKAYVPAAGDARQKANFVASMSTMGQEAVVGLPQNVDETGYDLELLEAKDRAFDTFGKAIEMADRSIILTIKSQNLTTEVSEGSFAAARQHGNTEQVTLAFDDSTFSHDLYTQLARPFAKFNFGDQRKACYSSWDVTPTEDYVAKSTVLATVTGALTALRGAGYVVDVKRLGKAYGLTLPIELTASSVSTQSIPLTPTDIATIVTVNEGRASQGLGPIAGADGELTIAEYKAKNATVIAEAAAAGDGALEPEGDEDEAEAAE